MSNRTLALKLLQAAGPKGVTTAEFLEAGCGSRFGARLQELRNEGKRIDSQTECSGSSRYFLRPNLGLAESDGEHGVHDVTSLSQPARARLLERRRVAASGSSLPEAESLTLVCDATSEQVRWDVVPAHEAFPMWVLSQLAGDGETWLERAA